MEIIQQLKSQGFFQFYEPDLYIQAEKFANSFRTIHANGYETYLSTNKKELGISFIDKLYRKQEKIECNDIYGLNLNKYAISYIEQKISNESRKKKDIIMHMLSIAKNLLNNQYLYLLNDVFNFDRALYESLKQATHDDRHILRLSWYFQEDRSQKIFLRKHFDENAITFFSYCKGGELVLIKDGKEEIPNDKFITIISGKQLEASGINPTEHFVRYKCEEASIGRISVSTKFYI